MVRGFVWKKVPGLQGLPSMSKIKLDLNKDSFRTFIHKQVRHPVRSAPGRDEQSK